MTTTYIIYRSPHRVLGRKNSLLSLLSTVQQESRPVIVAYNWCSSFRERRDARAQATVEQKDWEGLIIGYGKESRSYRLYSPQTRRITERRNATFMRHCPGRHRLLDTKKHSRRTRKLRKKFITGTFLGIYNYLVRQKKIKTQQRLHFI